MKVHLAGYNVDTEVLHELEEKCGKREDLTPEVLSAAYARISRDSRSIEKIRKDARSEVELARRSNSSIIFKMGHHSVAEHAVFNLDIVGLSRYAMEELEKFRLSSYTEKSQRYITLEKDFVLPEEVKNTVFEKMFIDMINEQNKAYFRLFDRLKGYVFEKYAELAKEPKNHNLLEGWAKEDARYVTALATESQVGQTVNARTLELMLRRFASHPLTEVKELGRMLYAEVSEVAPSIVIFHEKNDRDERTYPELRDLISQLTKEEEDISVCAEEEVKLVDFTKNTDNVIAASLVHTSTNLPYEDCLSLVQSLSHEKQEEIFKAACRNMQLYDTMLREFEYANLTFNIVLSAACFGQLKRHRMATITAQSYNPGLGVTIPESIKEIGEERFFQDIIDETNDVYSAIQKEIPLAAPYILTNAHRKRVLIRVNVRELYHMSRLREDAHAQWDIRNVTHAMTEKAKKIMPLTFILAGGKDRYNEIYKAIYGCLPRITEAALPGSRKIK